MSGISKDQQGLKIEAYLWSCPDMPHWKRLLGGILFIPYLIWCFLKGTPVLIGKWEMYQKGENYIYYRGKPQMDHYELPKISNVLLLLLVLIVLSWIFVTLYIAQNPIPK